MNMVMISELLQTSVIRLTKNYIEAIIRETFSDKTAQVNVKAATRFMDAV
jgi:Pyruvate/2-oxoacid:ferredoxin oxidoreductase gamma subunit